MRRPDGRSVCSASSGTSGGGPSLTAARGGAVSVGIRRPSTQPASAATATTAGNGTAKKVSATKDATARTTSAGCPRPLRPTRTTACSTIATTAGASPRKSDSTRVVSPKET